MLTLQTEWIFNAADLTMVQYSGIRQDKTHSESIDTWKAIVVNALPFNQDSEIIKRACL